MEKGKIGEENYLESAVALSHRFLEIANLHTEMNRLLKDFQIEIMNFSGCDSVGIRVLDKEGNIPYQTYSGFSKQFYDSESPLSVHSDKCMCIDVVKGDFDPGLPFYTEYGSFYMNGTSKFLATVSEDEKGSTRNVCNQIGYESVALIPIRIEEHVLGLIHIADHRENKVPPNIIYPLEFIGMQLGGAMQRVWAEEELRKHRDHLVEIVDSSTNELSQANKLLLQEIAVREKTERELRERVKELQCLYDIVGLMNKPGVSLKEVFQGAVELIPGAWQYPEIAMAQILMGGEEYASPNFKKTTWNQTSEINVFGKQAGMVEVGYLEEKPEMSEESFLKEERDLIKVIADQMGNITERKLAEEELSKERNLLRTLIDNLPDFIFVKDIDGRFVIANKALAELVGATEDGLTGKTDFDFYPKELAEKYYADEQEIMRSGRAVIQREKPIIDITGKHRRFSTTKVPLRDKQGKIAGIVGMGRDITEQKLAEERIRKSLKEKEVLLKEVHHRVKNNMQLVSSLISLQARFIKDEQILRILKDNQNRLKTMALIHEKLYKSNDLSRINFEDYLKSLTRDLFRAYRADTHKIHLKLEVSDIFFEVEQAIPCGFIINELVSNALKHAFPGQRAGKIRVSCRSTENGRIELTVSDDGIGIPGEPDLSGSSSLGLSMVKMLGEDQLQGEIKIDGSGGSEFRITFKKNN